MLYELALKRNIKDINILQTWWYVKIIKKIDGPVKYGMVLEGITVITHSNILYRKTYSELQCDNIIPVL